MSDPAVLPAAGRSLFDGVAEGTCEGAGGCWNSESVFEVVTAVAVVGVDESDDDVAALSGVFVAVAVFVDANEAVAAAVVVVVDAAVVSPVALEQEFATIAGSDNVEVDLFGLVRLVGFFTSG